jgi:hypothetical protein
MRMDCTALSLRNHLFDKFDGGVLAGFGGRVSKQAAGGLAFWAIIGIMPVGPSGFKGFGKNEPLR